MSGSVSGNPVKKGFMLNGKQASSLLGNTRSCGGEWWIDGKACGDPRTSEGNMLYMAYNGYVKTDGLDPRSVCGVRPALLVEGVTPDPRKNRKLMLDKNQFTFVGTEGSDAVYLSDSIISEASFEQALKLAADFGEKAKGMEYAFSSDPNAPVCLPVLAIRDLNFDGYMPDDDRICTDMSLSDYGYMEYILSTRIRTYDYGEIKAVWQYSGMTESAVYVRQIGEEMEHDYRLSVPSDLLLKSFTSFVRAWADNNDPEKDNRYAFNGGIQMLDLWNETVNVCSVESYYETDRDVPARLGWSINLDELRMLDGRFAEREAGIER